MVAKYAGRSTRRQKAIAANIRAQRGDCWLCGQPIDYSLKFPHPDSFTVDHVYTRGKHIDRAEDPANQRPAHMRCNSTRGEGDPPPSLGVLDREW